jgi:hypothetical protein
MAGENWTAQAIDDALAGTFPASDPPAWTPGIARPAPVEATPPAEKSTGQDQRNDGRAEVIDAGDHPMAARGIRTGDTFTP